MSGKILALKYALFASLAMVGNLGVQRFVFSISDSSITYVLAVLCGTVFGLLIKYFLDKNWIFYDFSNGLNEHSRKFTLYVVMGILTTLVFWGVETFFWVTWGTTDMREFGAVIGLIIGYWIKYNLDCRFVFKTNRMGPVA